MSTATAKMPVQCPQCGKQLMVPATAAGKQGRCPGCQHVFVLPALVAAEEVENDDLPALVPLSSDPWADPSRMSGQALAGLPAQAFTPQQSGQSPFQQSPAQQAVNPYMASALAQSSQNPDKYNHGFGLEHRGWDAGMMGGLAMMGISVVWFVGGLFFGILFYYPPILFIIGLIGFFRGLAKAASGSQ